MNIVTRVAFTSPVVRYTDRSVNSPSARENNLKGKVYIVTLVTV